MPAKRKSSGGGRLTAAEKRTITSAGSKAYRLFGRSFPRSRREEIFAIVQAMKASKRAAIGREAIQLWAARIEYAVVNGDKQKVNKLLKSPAGGLEAAPRPATIKAAQTKWYDSNGGCSCGGGTGPASW